MEITPKGLTPSVSPAGFVLQIHETIAGKQVFLTEDNEESSLYFAKVFGEPYFVYPSRGFWRAVDGGKTLLALEVANPPQEADDGDWDSGESSDHDGQPDWAQEWHDFNPDC